MTDEPKHLALDKHLNDVRMFVIECGTCDDRFERVLDHETNVLDSKTRASYTAEAWGEGWRIEDECPICPDCQDMFEFKQARAAKENNSQV